MDGQGTKYGRNIAEHFNRLSRVHERYRQTDGRATANSEREREFANKSTAVADTDDSSRAKWAEMWGLLCPFTWGSWVPV